MFQAISFFKRNAIIFIFGYILLDKIELNFGERSIWEGVGIHPTGTLVVEL